LQAVSQQTTHRTAGLTYHRHDDYHYYRHHVGCEHVGPAPETSTHGCVECGPATSDDSATTTACSATIVNKNHAYKPNYIRPPAHSNERCYVFISFSYFFFFIFPLLFRNQNWGKVETKAKFQ